MPSKRFLFIPSGSGEGRRRRNTDASGDDSNAGGNTEYDYSGDAYYENDDEYSDYRDDAEEYGSGYYNYDEEDEEEYPDQTSLSVEQRLRIEVDQLIARLDEFELYDNGHLFETLIRNCTWKGIDCKSGWV